MPCRTSKASLEATSGAEGEALTALLLGGRFFVSCLKEQPLVHKPYFFLKAHIDYIGAVTESSEVENFGVTPIERCVV